MSYKSINPYTGETIGVYTQDDVYSIETKIELSSLKQSIWKNTSFEHRSTLLHQVAKVIRQKSSELSVLITSEMGKLITESESEIEKSASLCDYYAQEGEQYLQEKHIKTDYSESYVMYQPLGIVFGIMPWNFPFWQVIRFAVPAIMAGNTVILKHASNVSGCAKAIEDAFLEAGFEEGIFQHVLVDPNAIEQIVAHPKISAVTLTGSEKAGSAIAALAGRYLKKTVLELGGSDPFIVLPDADIEKVATYAVKSRFQNCGQTCIAAKRFIIHESVYDEFKDNMIKRINNLKYGNPLDREVTLAPLARPDLAETLHSQLVDSLAKGAQLVVGGERSCEEGVYYPPTIIEHISKGMPAYDEEFFGPVALFFKVSSEEEAIFLANDTPYGLGASIWTTDIAKAKTMANAIDSGSVYINDIVKSDMRMPFGGVKLSGYGRELSLEGIREFVNIKSVIVK